MEDAADKAIRTSLPRESMLRMFRYGCVGHKKGEERKKMIRKHVGRQQKW